MPIYEYRCDSCRHLFEEFHAASDVKKQRETPCPKCTGLARRFFAFQTFASPGAIDASFAEDSEEYREMHYYEKKKDWERAAQAADGVSDFAKQKFLQKAKQEPSSGDS